MKFTDGFWMHRPGVNAAYAGLVYDATTSRNPATGEETLTVLAPTYPVEQRADTLRGPLLTISLSAPMPDTVRVRVEHFTGGPDAGPHFSLNAIAAAPEIRIHTDSAEITSGRLTACARRGQPWRLEFLADDTLLTSAGRRSLGFAETPDGRHHMLARLALAVGEHVYGLGERFGPLVKNGQVVDIWNADGGTSSEQAYKNVPFYLTDQGYGVFVNDPGPVSFEVACEFVSQVQFSLPGQSLEFVIIYGPTPKEILEKYTALTGRPALPPAWSFGLWLTTSFTTSYDEQTVRSFVDGMAARELPLSVFHFDCFWMREFQWCDFEWDPRSFPDPQGMLRRLKASGLHICVWINPYIAQLSPLFDEAKDRGLLVRALDGRVWQWDMWQPGMALVDFTNPEAREWFRAKLRPLLDMGVDAFKTDFGERIPTDVIYFDGSDPSRMHNYYTQLYNETVFELLREERGEREAVVFARSATAGGQRFPVHWGGDCSATFESMAESLRGGLSLGMSGFGFWSHDIGGFEGTPSPAVFKRWTAFGLLSTHSRLHGSESYRVPWLIDEESVDVLRHFARIKNRLMPYLYAAACQAHSRGVPVMRAMVLEFPDDPAVAYLDQQYMLGDALLVAPVFSESGRVRYYVPPGRWTHFLTGAPVEGPGWRDEQHDYFGLPLLVRPGAVLPLGGRDDRPDYDYADGVTLRAYGLADGDRVRVTVPRFDGDPGEFETRREDRTITVTGPQAPSWQVQLSGVDSVAALDGGTWEPAGLGALVRPDRDSTVVRVELARAD